MHFSNEETVEENQNLRDLNTSRKNVAEKGRKPRIKVTISLYETFVYPLNNKVALKYMLNILKISKKHITKAL